MAWLITRILDGVRLDEQGNFARTRIVQYMVEQQGPFQLELPVADFSDLRIRQLLDDQARVIEGLTPPPPG